MPIVDDSAFVRWSASDGLGNLLVAGGFHGTIDLGGGPLTSAPQGDAFLAKLDCAGNLIWAKQLDGATIGAHAQIWSFGVDASGGILASGDLQGTVDFGSGPITSSGLKDMFLTKWDGNGNSLWSVRYGAAAGASAHAAYLAVAPDGRSYISGSADGNADFGGGTIGKGRFYVLALDAAGHHVWSKGYGSGEFTLGLDASGNLLLTGTGGFPGLPLDFGGGPLPSGMFLAKLDGAGNHQWSKVFQWGGGPFYGSFSGQQVTSDPSGNIIVSGVAGGGGTADFGGGPVTLPGSSQYLVASFTPAGAFVFARVAGDVGGNGGARVTTDGTGNIFLAGSFGPSAVDFGGGPMSPLVSGDTREIFAVKLGPSGAFAWGHAYGDAYAQVAAWISIHPSGGPVIVGSYNGALDFGQGLLPMTSTAIPGGGFIAKLDP